MSKDSFHNSSVLSFPRISAGLVLFLLFLQINTAFGQFAIPATPTSGSYFQDFNTLPVSGSVAWTDLVTIPYWYMQRVPTTPPGGPYPINVLSDNGTSSTGSAYSYGTTGAADRALGSVGSNNTASGHYAWGIQFQNATTYKISDFKVAYRGEQWRDGGFSTTAQAIRFGYKTSATAITLLQPGSMTGWTALTALNFTAPVTNTSGVGINLDGNSPANMVKIAGSLPSLTLDPNYYVMIKWDDPKYGGMNDQGMATDSIAISWVVCSPPLTQASALTSPTQAADSIVLNWVNGNGSGRIVVINTVNNFTNPADGATFTPNTTYSGSGEQVIYNGSGSVNKVTVHGLLPCTDYYFKVFEYNCSGVNSKFNNAVVGSNNPMSFTSAGTKPTAYPLNGPSSYCSGTTFSISLPNSETNVNYQLYIDCPAPNTPVGTAIGGVTGNSISFPNLTVPLPGPCSFKVLGTNATSPTCKSYMIDSLTVSILPTPTYSISSADPVCYGGNGSFTLTGLLPNTQYVLSYSLDGTAITPATILTSGTGSFTLNGPAGSYTNIIITTLAGCPSIANSVNLVNPAAVPPPTVSVDPLYDTVCFGQLVTLNASNCTGTLAWNPTGSNQAIYPITPTVTTSFWATCTSALGCTSKNSDTLTIVVRPAPQLSNPQPFPPSACGVNDGHITLTVSPADSTFEVNYDLDGVPQPTQNIPSSGTQLIIPNLGGGSYAITITLNGCISAPVSTTLSAPGGPSPPTISAPVPNPVICAGDSVLLTATGCSGMVHWINGDSTASVYVKPLVTYTYTATCNSGNCPSGASNAILVTVNPIPAAPVITPSPPATTFCRGKSTTLTPSGCSGSLMWSTGVDSLSITVFPNNTTTYTVNCTENGCTSPNGSLTITIIPGPDYDSIHPISPSVCGGNDGAFSIYGLSAVTAYTVDYDSAGIHHTRGGTSNSSGQFLVDKLGVGLYSNIIVTTLTGCSSLPGSVNISDLSKPQKPSILPGSSTQICPNSPITLTANGCSGGIIQWNNSQTGNSIIVSPSVDTTYTATCKIGGCTSDPSDGLNITMSPPPTNIVLDTNATTNFTSTGRLEASATGTNLQYSIDGSNWNFNGIFTGLSYGWDTLQIMYGNGCIYEAPFFIDRQMAAVPTLTGDKDAACPGDIATIHVTGTGVTNITGVNICISYDPNLATAQAVTYHAPEFQNFGVDLSVQGQIYIYDNITPLVNIADGDTLFTIQFLGLQSGSDNLNWDEFKPSICGMTNQAGINLPPNIVPAILSFHQAPTATIIGSSSACEGTVYPLSAAGDTLSHVWTLPDGSTYAGQQYSIAHLALSDAGKYLLTTTNKLLCVDTVSLNLTVHPKPVVELSPNDPQCVELVDYLTPGSSFASYLWNDNTTGSSIPNQGEGLYWVVVKDAFGCEGADSLQLVVCPAMLFIPSAFSPNSDGLNDSFKANYSDLDHPLNNFKMRIYNRWGQLLFETNNINQAWDGNYNGEPCPVGVYTYVIKYDKPEGKTMLQKDPLRGLITLVR